MPKYVEPMSEDLLRQRRNVIIASCMVWFFHFGNVSINSISYSDIEFQINEKASLYFALWLFYFYAILRFFVYFMEEGWDALKFSFIKSIDESCIQKIIYIVSSKSSDENVNALGLSLSDACISRSGYKFLYKDNQNEESEISISYLVLIPYMLRGIGIFIFFRTALTDYVFPFIIAAYVFVHSGFSKWPGSLINLL